MLSGKQRLLTTEKQQLAVVKSFGKFKSPTYINIFLEIKNLLTNKVKIKRKLKCHF